MYVGCQPVTKVLWVVGPIPRNHGELLAQIKLMDHNSKIIYNMFKPSALGAVHKVSYARGEESEKV